MILLWCLLLLWSSLLLQSVVAIGDGDVVELARDIAKRHGFVGITMLNDGFASTALSWLCNTASFDSHKYTLFIATDDACVEKLTQWRSAHRWQFAIARFEPKDADSDGAAALQDSFSIAHVGYWKWLRHRVRLFNTIIDNSIDFLLFETDAVWFRCAFREWQRSDEVDIVGIRDGSQATAIGFGFLGVRANARVRQLWQTLTTRFDASIDGIAHLSPHSTLEAQPLSEQHIMSELIAKRFADVRFEFLPAPLYTNGKWFSDELVRRSVPSPYVINFNWLKGLPAKIAMARLWRFWFVDDQQPPQCTAVDHLPTMLTSDPLQSFNQSELHWYGCPCGPAGLPCWCRCCANDAGRYREQCRASGFCKSLCLDNADWCRVAALRFERHTPTQAERQCPNRFFHLIAPSTVRGDENLRDLTARAAKTVLLAHLLNRTAILELPSLTQHLLDTECVLLLREFQDLHSMASMWLNVVVHGDGRLGAACKLGDACLSRLSPRANIDIVADQTEPDKHVSDRLEPRGTTWRPWPREAKTLLHGLQLIADEIDPVVLSMHDAFDLKSPHSGVDHASIGIVLAKIGPAELMRDEHARQLRS